MLATVVGGAAALFGSVVAHALGSREERRRANGSQRRDAYVDYLVALDAAFGEVRRLADPDQTPANLASAVGSAFGDAGVYRTRERLLLVGNPSVISPAETVLHRIAEVRDAVRGGVKRRTQAYHDVYHRYAEALWHLRIAIREDLGSVKLAPADIDKETWDSAATCEFCRKARAGAVPAQPTAAG